MHSTAKRVNVEVAPLHKRDAAEQIDAFCQASYRVLDTPVEDRLELMSVRRDVAVKKPRGGFEDFYGLTEVGFNRQSFDKQLTDYHIAQAHTIGKWLTGRFDYEIENVALMEDLPESFITGRLDWQIFPENERLLPEHKLPSDNDTPGELGVCLYDRDPDRYKRNDRYMARLLLFNGLGGIHNMFPPAVAGIYQVNAFV